MKVEINAIKDEYTYIAEKLCICGRRERGLNIKINKVNIERLQSDDIEVESKSRWWMEKEEGLKIKINDIDKFLLTRVERYFAE